MREDKEKSIWQMCIKIIKKYARHFKENKEFALQNYFRRSMSFVKFAGQSWQYSCIASTFNLS